jgi:hypothetical protein
VDVTPSAEIVGFLSRLDLEAKRADTMLYLYHHTMLYYYIISEIHGVGDGFTDSIISKAAILLLLSSSKEDWISAIRVHGILPF